MTEEQFELHMRKIIDGDKEGLHSIYEAYGKYIFCVIYDVVKQKEDAEDMTTEFFIKLWKIAGKYQFGKGHRAWLGRIAHNLAIDYLRSKKQHVSYEEMLESEEAGQKDFAQESVERMSVKEAMAMLNTPEQEIVNMKIMLQMTFKEIAEAMQMPMGTVTWKYRQAMEKLRGCQL